MYNGDLTELIYCPEGKTNVVIAPSTTTINRYAFVTAKYVWSSVQDNPKLEEIYFYTCAPSIPENTFAEITSIAYYNNFLNTWPSEKRQNYGGNITWVEKAIDLSNCSISIAPTSYIYDGNEKKPTVTLKYNGVTLVNNINYTVSYLNNLSAGTATLTATGIGNFKGSVSKNFTIVKPTPNLTLANLSYSFGNHWDYFGYSRSYRIPVERYEMFFSKRQAEWMYANYGFWGGNCYGMSSSSGMFNTDGSGITINSFNSSAKSLNDLTVQNRSGILRLTVTELIEAMQVSQYHSIVQADYNRNIDINSLCQEVKKTEEGNPPVVISVLKKNSNGWGGHAVLGYKIEKTNNNSSLLYVYDCNYPNRIRTIDLKTNNSGTYTGWGYNMNDQEYYHSGSSNYKIAYIPYSTYQRMWSGRNSQSTNMLSVNSDTFDICDYAGNIVATMKNGVFSSRTDDVYEVCSSDGNFNSHTMYVPTDVYQIVNKDSGTPELEVTTVNVDQSASVTTSASKIIIAVDDDSEMNLVSVNALNGESYNIVVNSDLASSTGKEKIEYSGIGNGSTITVGMSSGNCVLTNCTGISMWINGDMVGSTSENYQKSINGMNANLAYTTCTYDGTNKEPETTLKNGKSTLKKGVDYVVIYENNIEVGTATANLYGIGSYTGKLSLTFKITAPSIENAVITGLAEKTYTGKALIQTPTLKMGSITLKPNADYIVSYSNNINAGTATITFTGKGKYSGTKTATFKIKKASQTISVKSSSSSIAVGKTATVSITGNKGTKSFKSSNTSIATVTSAGKITAKKVGTVTITATSAVTSNYNTASKNITIKVVPAATSSITASNQVTGINLTWKKVPGATGYMVYRGSSLIKKIKSGATVTCTDVKANTNGMKYTFKIVPTASTGNGTAKSITAYRVARPTISR